VSPTQDVSGAEQGKQGIGVAATDFCLLV